MCCAEYKDLESSISHKSLKSHSSTDLSTKLVLEFQSLSCKIFIVFYENVGI